MLFVVVINLLCCDFGIVYIWKVEVSFSIIDFEIVNNIGVKFLG